MAQPVTVVTDTSVVLNLCLTGQQELLRLLYGRILAASSRLQAGEVAALSLAVERKADGVLMDELAGRAAAASLGLRAIGLLGILRDAKEQSLISAVAPLLDRLEQEAHFWISASLRSMVLKAAGEVS